MHFFVPNSNSEIVIMLKKCLIYDKKISASHIVGTIYT